MLILRDCGESQSRPVAGTHCCRPIHSAVRLAPRWHHVCDAGYTRCVGHVGGEAVTWVVGRCRAGRGEGGATARGWMGGRRERRRQRGAKNDEQITSDAPETGATGRGVEHGFLRVAMGERAGDAVFWSASARGGTLLPLSPRPAHVLLSQRNVVAVVMVAGTPRVARRAGDRHGGHPLRAPRVRHG